MVLDRRGRIWRRRHADAVVPVGRQTEFMPIFRLSDSRDDARPDRRGDAGAVEPVPGSCHAVVFALNWETIDAMARDTTLALLPRGLSSRPTSQQRGSNPGRQG